MDNTFDPDEFLGTSNQQTAFDPDEFLGKIPSETVQSSQPQEVPWPVIISKAARPVLETGGAIAGGIVGGGPETPIGWAGGALGYGAGKAAADLLDRQLGLMQPIPNIKEAAKETGQDILQGGEIGAVGAAVNPVLQGGATLAKLGASAYFGPSIDAINAAINNPNLAKSTFPQTAEDLVDNLNTLQTNLRDIDNKTWESLKDMATVPKNVVNSMLDSVKADIAGSGGTGMIGTADQAAYDSIDNLSKKINGLGTNEFNQTQIREMLQSARKDVNFSDPTASPKNEALLSFTHNLSDYLKSQNPQYADLIQQSEDRSSLLDNAERAFSLNKQAGQFVPSNTTTSKLQALLKPGNIPNQQIAGQVKSLTGMDLQQAAQNAKYAGEFQQTATQGSRRVMMGRGIGAGVGALLGPSTGNSVWGGAALGGMAGGWADKYAAQNLGSTLGLIQKLGITSSVNPVMSLGLLSALAGKEQTDNQ